MDRLHLPTERNRIRQIGLYNFVALLLPALLVIPFALHSFAQRRFLRSELDGNRRLHSLESQADPEHHPAASLYRSIAWESRLILDPDYERYAIVRLLSAPLLPARGALLGLAPNARIVDIDEIRYASERARLNPKLEKQVLEAATAALYDRNLPEGTWQRKLHEARLALIAELDHRLEAEWKKTLLQLVLVSLFGLLLAPCLLYRASRRLTSQIKREYERSQSLVVSQAKLAALGEFALQLGHEINNPLHALNLKLNVLVQRARASASPESSALPDLEGLKAIVERINAISRGLKNMARAGEKDAPVLAAFNPILEETLALVKPQLKQSGIQLECSEIPGDAQICCRPVEVSQVLLNLIANSIDAVEPLAERWIRVGFGDAEDHWVLSVTDSGNGIPQPVREKLLQPFFTTKPPGKGTGLGLNISLSMIENMGGTLSIDADCPNTRFVVALPKAPLV